MGRRKSKNIRVYQRERARERESLERRWFRTITRAHEMAPLVTRCNERFHRWLPLRQGYSAELVRRFLSEASPIRERMTPDGVRLPAPLLDPFNGSGTLTIECTRQGVPSVGVEALASFALIARAASQQEFPALPAIPPSSSARSLWQSLPNPTHRAALLVALARQGWQPSLVPPSLPEGLSCAVQMIQEDLGTSLLDVGACRNVPLPAGWIIQGDARLLPLRDASIGGILTSPPYLFRYNYARIAAELERACRFGIDQPPAGRRREREERQLGRPSSPRSYVPPLRGRTPKGHDSTAQPLSQKAVDELALELSPRQAKQARSYFDDLRIVLRECARVLLPGAPLWIVIAGTRIHHVHIPSDLILVELAVSEGLEVQSILEVRRFHPTGYALGGLRGVSPRESILGLRSPVVS